MDKVLKQEGLDLEPDSHEYRQVAEVALRAAIEINRMQQSRLFGSFNPKPTDEILATSPKKPTVKLSQNDVDTSRGLKIASVS